MIKFCMPELPEKYWVNNLTYKCESCGSTFEVLIPNGNDIVKFKEINGSEIRWLPTFSKGGYIDLMTKIIEGHKLNDSIDMKKATLFISKLQGYIEKSSHGNGFELSVDKRICPQCNSENLKIIQENVLVNPELQWLKILCDLLK
ncbi:hypothetical protein [Aminipila terrae]|uniref:Uncharacterized protein n=1 Tax=Aminipila terrae TaxID=2697030 RepID=A0A6P1MIB6_9FIRM|nr:hypothetical protein [Aminipila terrae]QHI73481.1 hypothetical protein Ami3637_14825 [Aminipila terrae]